MNAVRGWTIGTALALSLACGEPGESDETTVETITEGVIEFEVDYDGLGAMGALLPKSETVYFRGGQRREEKGPSVLLTGIEPGRQIHLMSVGGVKLALSYPLPRESAEALPSELRFEETGERRQVAGLSAREVEAIELRDPSNRLSVWVTDQISGQRGPFPEIPGFAVDYVQPINDGEAHYRLRSATAQAVDPSLFEIPEGFQRRDLESASQVMAAVNEAMAESGGQMQVFEAGDEMPDLEELGSPDGGR